jgi:Skp family chaperone for outer membrane proteins
MKLFAHGHFDHFVAGFLERSRAGAKQDRHRGLAQAVRRLLEKTAGANPAQRGSKAQFAKDAKSQRDDLKKGSDEYQKLLEQANDQAFSAEQRDKYKQTAADKLKQLQDSKTALDQYERQAQITMSEKSQRMRDNILSDIKAAVAAQAKVAGYQLVIDAAGETANATTAVVYSSGENDLTDAVLKRLNAGRTD